MMKNNILLALAVTLFIQLYPTESQAYRYWNCYGRITKWNSPPTFYYNGVSFPNNSSGDYWMSVFETEIDKIRNSGAGSTIKNIRNGGRYGGNRVFHGNGRSEIFFTISSDNIGHANTRWSWCGWHFVFDFDDWRKYYYSQITESDFYISLDSNRYLKSSVNSFRKTGSESSKPSMRNVIIHELGHALGMKEHEQRWPLQTMRSHSPSNESGNWNGGKFWPYPSSDYLTFLYDAYGKSESFYDFSISSIRIDYSTPSNTQETRILLNSIEAPRSHPHPIDKNGKILINYPVDPNCTYQLDRNTDYKLEVTFLNQGNNTQHNGVKGKVYVSSNNYISTWDTPVSSEYTFYSTSRWPYTYKVPFRIASNQLSNNRDYYIGYVIDYNNQYQEKYEGRTNGGANLCKIRIAQ